MAQNKYVGFIIPFFGSFPNYFPLFLKSCERNSGYDWLIFTDNYSQYSYPENVKVFHTTFEELKKRVERAFPFPVKLPFPYKLCDFKPAYGLIFREELSDYKYWGYCDVDLILGNLTRFLDEEQLRRYQKHFYLGHMCIYENTDDMRTLFFKGHARKDGTSSKYGYLDVFGSGENRIFDEWSEKTETINEIAENRGVTVNPTFPMLDIRPWRSRFYSSVFDADVHKWLHNSSDNYIVTWEEGSMYAFSTGKDRGELIKKEILYAHFQKRALRFNLEDLNSEKFIIYPNRIKACEEINDKRIKRCMSWAKIRRWLRVDERRQLAKTAAALWKHRAKKLVRMLRREKQI